MPAHILRIACSDRKGIIHAVTGVLLRHGLNIEEFEEHVDQELEGREGGRFFMRMVAAGELERTAVEAELAAVLPEGAAVALGPQRKKRVVVLVTREHHCLAEILVRHAYESLPAEILAVVGNHPDLRPLVERFGLPFHVVPHAGLDRAEHEAALLAALEPYRPELLVLAKYMRVLSPPFVARYAERMINIHHSFLPAFAGPRPYQQAHERGVKLIGATAHFVTDELDDGPIIAQGVLPVTHAWSERAMAQAGRDVEKLVLARALRLVLEERVVVHGRRTVVFE